MKGMNYILRYSMQSYLFRLIFGVFRKKKQKIIYEQNNETIHMRYLVEWFINANKKNIV